MKRALFGILLLLFFYPLAAVAQSDPLSPSARYNPSIPTVESVLGYRVGDDFTLHYDLERYYQRLAAASNRLQLVPYGRSIEGRTLYLAIFSAPENLARLDAIREATARLSDPRRTPPAEAQALAETTPVVVWLSYNVHGNEAVSSEAALQVAYELAASEDPKVTAWLASSVIVLDPIVNPDGRDRYVNFYRTTVGAHPNPDPFAAEHQERWPGGRTNHYLFDLNRDWAWQTQPETRARLRAYREWNPQVHVDYHEMGSSSTYAFSPPAKPILDSIAARLMKWFDLYGQGNAAAFDRYAFRYYTGEDYDLFYPSYGDTWPSLNGAVGMTYEQAGGGVAGLVLDLPEGERRLTLRDRAARHFVSSLATIETSVAHRQARLRDYYEFRSAALAAGRQGPMQQFFLVPGADPERLARVIEILLRQGIEVQRAAAAFEADALTSAWGEPVGKKRLPAGTYVVDLAQPAGFLARALLEREAKLEATFFYDVTAWSLPLAAGVEAYAGGKPARGPLTPVTQPPPAAGVVEGAAQAAAYVFSSESTASIRLLSRLLAEGFNAYVSLKPFTLSGRAYSAGALVVPAENNPPTLAERVRALAEQTGARVHATATLRADDGIDLGSRNVRFLRQPRVAILTDTPVNPYAYGALWHHFEERLGLPFTALRVETLRNADLDAYNVLILPDDSGQGRGYARVLDKSLISRLDAWVRQGGVLIGAAGGAVFATKKKAGLASITYRYVRREDEEARLAEEREAEKPAGKEEPEKEADLERKLLRYAEREEALRKEEIPGAILRTVLDTTHPLGFGLGERLAVLNRTAPILALTADGENVAYFPADNLKLSGFLSPENEKKLAQTAYLLREAKGRGQVILFADMPVFRGFWDSTARLLENAVLFGNVTQP